MTGWRRLLAADRLSRGLDQFAALDLRWAIFSLYIATIDVALGYWA
jgi:hypothetical protein